MQDKLSNVSLLSYAMSCEAAVQELFIGKKFRHHCREAETGNDEWKFLHALLRQTLSDPAESSYLHTESLEARKLIKILPPE